MSKVLKLVVVLCATIVLGYPVCAMFAHGLDPSFWPSDTTPPREWLNSTLSLSFQTWPDAYWKMLIGRSPAFPFGGFPYFVSILTPITIWILIAFYSEPIRPLRDKTGVFGQARFANADELNSMRVGLELGRNPKGGDPVRVTVEGTLITIAPPRKGKTSGLLIPNLAYPEPASWDGPAVVIDTKGEIFRAVGDRRTALGRNVICLDPLSLVDGSAMWNPLRTVRPGDILYLQRTALALLPEGDGHNESSSYFRNRAVDLIVGAMIGAIRENKRYPFAVYELLSNGAFFQGILEQYASSNPAVLAAIEILKADPKTRDPIQSTALQAFQWMADVRLRKMVRRSTFRLSDVCNGDSDLFIAVPPEYKKLLAPFLRWLLSDLFAAIREERPKDRVFIFVDEAAALGRFDEILVAAAEMPGYNASLWTFWQDRSQIVSLYGEAGASTLVNTADVVTLFNLSSVDPEETERWSQTIGDFTALVSSTSAPTEGKGNSTTTRAPQGARLMTPSALVTMPGNELLAFVNSGAYTRHPILLHKTIAHDNPRFDRLIQSTKRVT